METNDNASRREVEIELKGKAYTVRALDLNEYGELENYVRKKYVKLYRETAEDVDPKEREAAVREIIRTPMSPEELGEEIVSGDGAQYMAYLTLRHNPGLTHEAIDVLVDMKNIKIISDAIDNMNDSGEEGEADATENPPTVEIPSTGGQ